MSGSQGSRPAPPGLLAALHPQVVADARCQLVAICRKTPHLFERICSLSSKLYAEVVRREREGGHYEFCCGILDLAFPIFKLEEIPYSTFSWASMYDGCCGVTRRMLL